MTIAEKILAKCAYNEASDDVRAFRFSARIEPIIRALINDRESLTKALNYYQATPFCLKCKSKSKPDADVANEALAQSEQTTREIIGGGE